MNPKNKQNEINMTNSQVEQQETLTSLRSHSQDRSEMKQKKTSPQSK